MFDRMRIHPEEEATLLVVGGAGGVGSIATQLARARTRLQVIATASRPETVAWCLAMGAHHVIDHRQPLAEQAIAIAPGGVKYILGLTKVEDHFAELVDAVAPQGALGLIENVARPIDINLLKPKNVGIHWEFMFGRAKFQTADMDQQGSLLTEVGRLVDEGQVKSTAHTYLKGISVENLLHGHKLVESGAAIGKIVLEP
jgi:zinc-binding alcohol dehydrogenase family protein